MNEIKCPKCGTVFTIDESDYDSIVKQIRDHEFEKQIREREEQYKQDKENAIKIAKAEVEKSFNETIKNKELEINNLKSELKINDTKKELAIKEAINEKDKEIGNLNSKLELDKKEFLLKEKTLKENYEEKLSAKDEQIAYYKDFKAKQSTKMIGESLEQHCNTEFNRVRTYFNNCTFEKDNDSRDGSKGDFIFRYFADDEKKQELVSIMFEMKNEADETATKHKNEDFFKELDKDRNEKKCEYAVLVSLLESNNDYYNDGIVDVSYAYDKMYVIRPQFFVPIITLITNLSKKSLDYRRELEIVRNNNIDIRNFEERLAMFKDGFSKNYLSASRNFKDAIDEIDKAIKRLEAVKSALTTSENQLRLANNKAEDLTIKKLTSNNPTMAKMFEELNNKDNYE